MSTKFIPSFILSTYDAISGLNANFSQIASLFDKCLMRDGIAPNSMEADLDMNHFSIKNVGTPSDPGDLVRLSDISSIISSGNPDMASLASSLGASLVGFITTGTGAVLRTIQSKLRDLVGLKDFGTTGDGTTNDTTGVTNANTVSGKKFVTKGTYLTTINPTALDGPFWGEGQIKDSNGNKRAPWFSAVKAAPSAYGNENSAETAFNGDLSKNQIAMEHRITGTSTLQQPTTGYVYSPEAYPFYGFLYNSSGWNQATNSNAGRTAACFFRVRVYQAGQGDAVAYNASAFVTGAKAGATHFLANPAAVLFNGDMTAGADGVYCNPVETNLDLNGHDAAAIGYVVNIKRDVGDTVAGLMSLTGGFRGQSTGTYAVDSIVSGSGLFKYGLDVTPVTFTSNKAAVVLKTDDRIYGSASTSDGLKATSLGTDFITRDSNGFWNFVYNNVSAMQVNASKVAFLVPPQIPTVTTSQLPAAAGSNKGCEYFVSDANATTRLSAVVGGGTNFVKVFSTGTQWLIQ